jgi:hypothetical protein
LGQPQVPGICFQFKNKVIADRVRKADPAQQKFGTDVGQAGSLKALDSALRNRFMVCSVAVALVM